MLNIAGGRHDCFLYRSLYGRKNKDQKQKKQRMRLLSKKKKCQIHQNQLNVVFVTNSTRERQNAKLRKFE
jgi:hypothetical protein